MSGHDDGNYSPRPEKGKGATESGPAAGYGTARQGQNIENDLRDDNSLRTAGPEQPPGDNNSKPEPGEQDQTDIRRASEQSRRDTRAPGSSEAGSSRRLQGIRVDTSSVRSSTDRNVRPAELSDANLALLPQADYKFRVPPSDDDPAPWEGQELPETFDVARMERQIEALSAEPTPEEMERLRLTKSRFDELPEQEKTKLQDHRLSEMMNPARDNQSLGQARDISKAELWFRSLLATREPVSYLKTRLSYRKEYQKQLELLQKAVGTAEEASLKAHQWAEEAARNVWINLGKEPDKAPRFRLPSEASSGRWGSVFDRLRNQLSSSPLTQGSLTPPSSVSSLRRLSVASGYSPASDNTRSSSLSSRRESVASLLGGTFGRKKTSSDSSSGMYPALNSLLDRVRKGRSRRGGAGQGS
jgi:hypothetical protein